MSDASRTQLLIRPESVWGETVAAPQVTTRLRFTGETLSVRNTTVLSDEIRSDRQRTDAPLVGIDAQGEISQEMIYSPEFDMQIEAALCGTWATDKVRNGVTNRSFGIEAGFLDIAKYIYFNGMALDQLTIDVSSRAIATLVSTFMGKGGVPASTSIAGATTPTAPGAKPAMKAGSGISILSAGGSNEQFAGVEARKITLVINNNLRERPVATSKYNFEPGRNVMEITGTIETYFQDIVRYTAFLANEFFAAKFKVVDLSTVAAANTYTFLLPSLKVVDAPVTVPGNDQDIIQTFQFRALVETAVGYAIEVERAIIT